MDDDAAGLRVDQASIDSMQLDGEAVVLNLSTHAYFGLNATGTQVWELIRAHAGITSQDVAAALADRYGRDVSVVSADVDSVLQELVQHGLVVRGDASPVVAPQVEAPAGAYERPSLQAYGNLDTLILSGE